MAQNGADGSGSLLGLQHHSDAETGFSPLNLEPSSAAVPGHTPSFGRAASSSNLGRATSSKKCIIIAVVVAVVTISLAVGLGVGLSNSGEDSATSGEPVPSPGPSPTPSPGPAPPPSSSTPAKLMARSASTGQFEEFSELSDACQELATGDYWAVLTPTAYALNLSLTADMFKPDADVTEAGTDYFSATVDITFNVSTDTSCVLLNAKGLTNLSVLDAAGEAVPGASASAPFERWLTAPGASQPTLESSGDQDLVAIDLGDASLAPDGDTVLRIGYQGVLGNTVSGGETGLLRSAPFVPGGAAAAAGGSAEVLVVTQGATNGARQIMPCYDQPRFKAVFEAAVQAPSAVKKVLSNGECSIEGMGDVVTWQCEPSEKMSSYLFALAAGNLVEVTADQFPATAILSGSDAQGQAQGEVMSVTEWAQGLKVRVWGVGAADDRAMLAASIAQPAFLFYADLLGIAPGNQVKYDLLAVPGKTGAMENWGLLLFDERRFLYNAATDGGYGLLQAATVICHEIAHQWFGNLATKQDWTMLSIDEGLSSFVEYKCMEFLGNLASNSAADPSLDATVEALKNQGVDLLQHTSDVTFLRSSTPQIEVPSFHDAPIQMALTITADPTQSPLVPPTDLSIGTGSFPHYAKPAALMRMFELFLSEAKQIPGSSVMPTVLGALVRNHQYSTYNWGDFFETAYQVLKSSDAATPNDDQVPALVALRSQTMWNANTYAENMALVTAALAAGNDSMATMATWFYMPSYPIFSFANGSSINASSYFQTTQNYGLTSRPFCSFNLGGSLDSSNVAEYEIPEAAQAQWGSSVSQLANRAIETCGIQPGIRFYPSSLSFDNLTACAYDNNATGNWSTRWGQLAPTLSWVDNQYGGKLFRSVYNKTHFNFLVNELASMGDVCDDITTEADNKQGQCCTRQTDLLEGAALLADATAVAMAEDAMANLQDVQLRVVDVLRAIEKALTGGDAANGQWQYLIGGAAVDALFSIKRMDEWTAGTTCSKNFARYIVRQVERFAASAYDDWLVDATAPPPDLLKQLAGPRLLWQVGVMPSAAGTGGATDAVVEEMCRLLPFTPLFRRYLLPQLGAPEGSEPAGDEQPSADLLPGIYMVAASMPANCSDAILSSPEVVAATNDSLAPAQLPARLAAALQDCYRRETDQAEALRCLYAMPMLGLAADTRGPVAEVGPDHVSVELLSNETLPYLFGLGTGATAISETACGQLTNATAATKDTCKQRLWQMMGMTQLPTLVTNSVRSGSYHYAAAVQYIKDNWSQLLPDMARNPSKAVTQLLTRCQVVEQLPSPVTPESWNLLMEPSPTNGGLLKNLTDSGCPPTMFVRQVGRAEQLRNLLENQADAVCRHVEAVLGTS